MTEQEIATYVETYINNITSSAQSLCWCYFLAGFGVCVAFFGLLDLLKDPFDNFINKIIEKKKQKTKESEDKK